MKDINKLLEVLKNFTSKEKALESIYVLKAWQKLSLENKIENELSFDTFYNQEVDIEKLDILFDKLSKSQKLFKLFSFENKFDNDELKILLGIVVNNDLPDINDALYNQRAGDFNVSKQIAELGIRLFNNEYNEMYVPFTNGFTYIDYVDTKIYADFPVVKSELVAELIKILNDKDIEFHRTDALSNPTFINKDASHLLQQFDNVFSCPPLRLTGELDTKKDIFNRFKIHSGKVLDVAQFEHVLAQTKNKAVVLKPVGLTYRGYIEEAFRKYLIEINYLEAIVQLPPSIFVSTSVETTFFVINKHKDPNDKNVYFLNLKNDSFITRDSKKFVLKNIDEIIDIYMNKKVIDNISYLATQEEILNNNCSFAIDRYVFEKKQMDIQKKLDSFKLVSLSSIAQIKRSQLFKDEEIGLEVHEISPSDFTKAGFTSTCSKTKQIGTQTTRLNTYQLEPYDVLLSTKGIIGKVAVIGEITTPMIASQAIQVIRINSKDKKNDAIKLYIFLKSDLGQSILFSLVGGSSMPQISTKDISNLKIPIVDEEKSIEILNRFKKEIELYEEVALITEQIKSIHKEY